MSSDTTKTAVFFSAEFPLQLGDVPRTPGGVVRESEDGMMGLMTNEGADVKARRERLGLDRVDLAREAGVSVDTLRDFEEGVTNARGSTISKITGKLADIEAEASMSARGGSLMEFEVTGDFGVRVVVKGPVTDAHALEEAVARLVRDIRSRQGEGPSGD